MRTDSLTLNRALVDEWDQSLVKEAIPGARLLGRILKAPVDAARAVAGPAGQLAGKLPGAQTVSKHFADSATRQIWKGRGGGAALGAGAGAIHGAATAEEGQRGAGALRGAVKGSLLGLAGGQVATQAGRAQLKRVGQRQAHALTGYVPRTQEQIARGVGRFGKGMTNKERQQAFQTMVGKQRLSPGMQEASYRGLTSVPGMVKGLIGPGAKGQRLHNLKTVVRSQGAMAPIMTAGFTAPAAYAAAKSDDPAALGESIGSGLGYIAGTPIPIAGNIALGTAGGAAGRRIGEGVGRLLGRTPRSQ